MKTKKSIVVVVLALALVLVVTKASKATQMGTGFTYQGRLIDANEAADGLYDFQFRLFNDANVVDGNQVGSDVNVPDMDVIDGYFTVLLDFNDVNSFNGEARWLEIGVRPGEQEDSNAYTPLSPPQQVTPAPYALALPGLWTEQNTLSPNIIGGYSGNIVANGISGATIGGGGLPGNPNKVTAVLATVGGGVSNDASGNGATVGGGGSNTASSDFSTVCGGWANDANGVSSSTIGGGQNNTASGYYATIGGGVENTASNHASTVGGGRDNTASQDYATVGGGTWNAASGYYATIGGGRENTASEGYATVGGGSENTASEVYATVGGGHNNNANVWSTVGGGYDNDANGQSSTVSGGSHNTASGHSATVGGGSYNDANIGATVGGGYDNDANGQSSTVSGGSHNTASGHSATVGGGQYNVASGSYATIPGGQDNTAGGDYSFAAGYKAKANHDGSFVWADITDANFASTANDQFLIRASGNVGIDTNSPSYKLDVNGDIRAIGSVYYGGTVGNSDGTAYTKPDYVFEQGYNVMSTEQVEEYLKRENHLPWMTSAKAEQKENGDVIDMTRMAFETVETAENLQVQVIEQQKKITALEERLKVLEKMMAQRFAVAKEVQ